FRELLLHAAARENLYCPAYILMPDHIHLLWMGLKLSSDQINAMRFLRQYLQVEFTRRSFGGMPSYQLQKQSQTMFCAKKNASKALSRRHAGIFSKIPCGPDW